MSQHQWPQHQPSKTKLLILSVLALFLFLDPIAWAGYEPGGQSPYRDRTGTGGTRAYNPPPGSDPTTPTTSTGTRGNCEGTAKTAFTVLAPISHAGATTSTHPTFAWFVPEETAHPVEFSLYESLPNGKYKRIQTLRLQSSPGIMKLTLPSAKPGLAIGQKYLWQVALLCNPNRPSSDLVAEASITVTAPPPSLKMALSTATTSLQRAQLYGQAGFWYDALSETLNDTQAKAFRLKLLEALVQLEASQNSRLSQQSQQLQQIIAIEQAAK